MTSAEADLFIVRSPFLRSSTYSAFFRELASLSDSEDFIPSVPEIAAQIGRPEKTVGTYIATLKSNNCFPFEIPKSNKSTDRLAAAKRAKAAAMGEVIWEEDIARYLDQA
jgi:hypothetical protein